MKVSRACLLLLTLTVTTSQALGQTNKTSTNIGRSAEATLKGESQTQVQLRYAQTAEVWDTVFALKGAQGNLVAINDVLKKKYGKPEEAFSVFSVGYENGLYVSTGAEALGFGLVQNPVIPELHANLLAAGTVSLGYHTFLERAGLHVGGGLTGGMGREKRVDAVSTDLIDKLPIRNGAIALYGFDLKAKRDFRATRESTLVFSAALSETAYETKTPPSKLEEDEKAVFYSHRWKATGSLDRAVEMAPLNNTILSLEGIAGPQPLPVQVLPRIWDYAHQLNPFPELGTMFGCGIRIRTSLGKDTSFESHGGFYGGYPGGDLRVTWKSLSLVAGSWGIETTSAYRTLGERLWQGGVSAAF